MKHTLTILILLAGINLFGQTNNLTGLVMNSLKLSEPNPTHLDETKALNEIFIGLLKNPNENFTTNIMELFEHVNLNAISEFEDDVDIRRMKSRLCICYSSIALLSDKYRFEYFLDLAKYSILDSDSKPEEFLEKQYCGLIMLKIWLKLKYNLNIQSDIKDLDYNLNLYQKALPSDYFNTSKLIVKHYKIK